MPDAVSVRLLVPLPGAAIVLVENAAVTPSGKPLAERATLALKPFTKEVVRVTELVPLGAMLVVAGLAVSVKLGVKTVSESACGFVMPAPVAEMVKT